MDEPAEISLRVIPTALAGTLYQVHAKGFEPLTPSV